MEFVWPQLCAEALYSSIVLAQGTALRAEDNATTTFACWTRGGRSLLWCPGRRARCRAEAALTDAGPWSRESSGRCVAGRCVAADVFPADGVPQADVVAVRWMVRRCCPWPRHYQCVVERHPPWPMGLLPQTTQPRPRVIVYFGRRWSLPDD
ncbi:unnamed protein product [Cuscuta epithymum]|uniref:Uncharacterized protein n=1 Tax=Cuscuta epithymum TaxID=186058 RepID=A0AAV0FK69_9ASTE|nr:unnamed protein product [Cuscuta epithymum]